MKYIFIFLAIVNLAYFGYARFIRDNSPPPVVRMPDIKAPARIELLSESRGHEDVRKQQIDQAINNAVRGDTENNACLAIGPFADVFSGQAVVSQLKSLDIDAAVRAVDKPTGQSDFRVLIPPASSLQDAFRKLRELKSRNIDSYVITQGKNALGVSLGVFATRDGAEKMKARRESEGYSVDIVPIARLDREFWVFSANGGDLALDPELWQSLLSEHEGISQKPMTCPSSTQDNPAGSDDTG